MQNWNDAELLRDYAAKKSEAAFGEIVRRYADFVYSAALRQTGNGEQARDVAQTVFVDLARKADSLRANTVLIGWLCQGARLAALEQLRKDQRRQQRERQAMELLDNSPDAAGDWQAVRPALDEAIASLGHEDRDALLLRFFKNESLASVGTTLGVSEDAAQKRVARALDKLRGFLAQRGITTTAAALSAALMANAVKAAPTGFAASLTTGALAKAAAGSSTVPLLKVLTFSKMKAALLVAALTGGVAGLTLLHFHSQRELREARALAEQSVADADALRAAREQLASQSNDLERLRRDAQDVLRLRGEVAQLHRDLAERKTILAQAGPPSETNRAPEFPHRQITIKAQIVSVPAGFVPGESTGILTDPQFRQLNEAVAKIDSTVISSPQVTTLSGRQARLMVGQSIPVAVGSYTNVGLILDLIPTWASNSPVVNLDFVLRLAKLAEGPAPEDGSIPGVEVAAFTNSVTVWDGQTVMLTRRISGFEKVLQGESATNPTEPKSLLIFLTPSIIDPVGSRLFTEEEINSYQGSNAAPAAFPDAIPEQILSTNGLRASALSTFPQPVALPADR
jgi:RNA polymerase sigma factor (sigma-70 family)